MKAAAVARAAIRAIPSAYCQRKRGVRAKAKRRGTPPDPRETRGSSLFYREAGQFKTSYAADMAVFPIRQDRIGLALILAVAFLVIPAFGGAFFLETMMIPFLVLSLAAIGLNLLTGYTGLLSLGSAGFMGVGAYACYKLDTYFPAGQHSRLDRRIRAVFERGRRAVRPAEPAHQGLLSRGGDAGGAVLPRMGVRARALALQRQRLRRDRGRDAYPVRRAGDRAERGAGDALSRRADHRDRDGLDRLQHHARADRAHVDGGARHGHRRGTDRHPAAAAPSCSPSPCLRSTSASRGR